jgi:hypothetical protein
MHNAKMVPIGGILTRFISEFNRQISIKFDVKIHIEIFRPIYFTSDSVDSGHAWDRFCRFSTVVVCSNPTLGVAVKVSFEFVVLRRYKSCEWSIPHPTSFTKYQINGSEAHKQKCHSNFALSVSLHFCVNRLKGGYIDQSYIIHIWNEAQTT